MDRKPIPPLYVDRGVVYIEEDKAEDFADTLERECWLEKEEETSVRRALRVPDDEVTRHITTEEVRENAPGYDDIPNTVFKVALTNIVKAMLKLSYVETKWKHTETIVLQNSRTSYRIKGQRSPFNMPLHL